MKIKKLTENWDNLDLVDSQAVVSPAYKAAQAEHRNFMSKYEETKKEMFKASGISEEEFKAGFTGAGKNNEKVKSRPETKKMHLSEEFFAPELFGIGDKICILHSELHPELDGLCGVIQDVDKVGQLFGSWGQLPVCPECGDSIQLSDEDLSLEEEQCLECNQFTESFKARNHTERLLNEACSKKAKSNKKRCKDRTCKQEILKEESDADIIKDSFLSILKEHEVDAEDVLTKLAEFVSSKEIAAFMDCYRFIVDGTKDIKVPEKEPEIVTESLINKAIMRNTGDYIRRP